ncbi:MAG: stage V sporulation protein AB [Caldicoprobacter oshimai]|uniref:Stage V sporulation protein AB n=1 Tax=Caldicoprobacter faecalis TaxID=937334 RepID=A0A1I5RJ63_9FIRM|nr:stage V sporulation protein AB [Caldicoprobacter faecalis]PZN08118.1 MAG: stage V sporulation protein AB [Caldicoprobacter oshimai]SFP58578.1 stage V sporulation protein AB [Caldicoprobacter faecalis]
MKWESMLLEVLIGLAGGLVVGGGLSTLFIALGIAPRLVSLSGKKKHMFLVKLSILAGAFLSSLVYVMDLRFSIGKFALPVIALFMGIFVGMLASALAEVLDVLYIVASYAGIIKFIYILVFAIIIGKIAGSLIYWLLPGFY